MKFCADYCEDHLIPALVTSIQKLKLLTSSLENKKKLEIYEKHYKEVSKGVLKYLQISETEYSETRARTTEKGMKRELSREESDSADVEEEEGEDKKKSSVSLVLSSRNKSLEELPTISSKKVETSGKTRQFTPRSKSRPSKFIKGKSKSDGGGAGTDTETDITEFIKDGEILYPRLIKDEISKLDAKLLKAAKKTNNIGGKVVLPVLTMFPTLPLKGRPSSSPSTTVAMSGWRTSATPAPCSGTRAGWRCRCRTTTSPAS